MTEKKQYKFFNDGEKSKLIINDLNPLEFVTIYRENNKVVKEAFKYAGNGLFDVTEKMEYNLNSEAGISLNKKLLEAKL